MTARAQRLVGVAGLFFLILILLSIFIIPTPPDTNARAATLVAYLYKHKTGIRVQTFMTVDDGIRQQLAVSDVGCGVRSIRLGSNGRLTLVFGVVTVSIGLWIGLPLMGIWVLIVSIMLIVRAGKALPAAASITVPEAATQASVTSRS